MALYFHQGHAGDVADEGRCAAGVSFATTSELLAFHAVDCDLRVHELRD